MQSLVLIDISHVLNYYYNTNKTHVPIYVYVDLTSKCSQPTKIKASGLVAVLHGVNPIVSFLKTFCLSINGKPLSHGTIKCIVFLGSKGMLLNY